MSDLPKGSTTTTKQRLKLFIQFYQFHCSIHYNTTVMHFLN